MLESLWSITQGPNETFESYTKRFTTTYSYVTNMNEDFAIQAFKIGVTSESVQYVFYGLNIMDIEALIAKAQKLSKAEEMRLSLTVDS